MSNISLPSMPPNYRLAEPGERIKEGFGYINLPYDKIVYLDKKSALVRNKCKINISSTIWICPITPPELHLPFTEADPLPEGKEGEYLILQHCYNSSNTPQERIYQWHSNEWLGNGCANISPRYYRDSDPWSQSSWCRYGIFTIKPQQPWK